MKDNADRQYSLQREELLQLIVENVRDYAIFVQDADGLIVSWNQGVEHILGYGEKEFVGRHISVIFTPEDLENGEVEKEMQTAATEGRAENRRWRVCKNGSRLWVNGLLMPLADSDGNLRGYVKFLRDDSEWKKHEDEREGLLAGEREARRQAERLRFEIERAKQAQDEFLALLAHELRSPLNAILGWVRILRKGLANEQQTAKALETIEQNAQSQNQLIEDVFDASRINSGNLRLNLHPMSLSEAVSQAVESVRPAAEAKNISLETSLDVESVFIMGDIDRVRQVVVNLLSNAVKFTGEDGRIVVRLENSGSKANLVIEDNGRGISAELLPAVFDRYAQADKDSTRGKAGLGLGLPLVRKLVEQHGGTTTADSAGEGRGAVFTVLMPVLEVK
jgi:PAS domain S-box-containing protein